MINQIAYADRILINKLDLIEPSLSAADSKAAVAVTSSTATKLSAATRALISRVRTLNRLAPIYLTAQSRIELSEILDLHAFEARDAELRITASDSGAAAAPAACSDSKCSDHSHSHSHSHTHSHSHSHSDTDPNTHDQSITTEMLELPPPQSAALDPDRLKVWISDLLWTESYEQQPTATGTATATATDSGGGASIAKSSGHNTGSNRPFIYRMKGILHLSGSSHPHYLQAVGEVFEIQSTDTDDSTATTKSKSKSVWPAYSGAVTTKTNGGQPFTRIVVIGRNLNRSALQTSFERCISSAASKK